MFGWIKRKLAEYGRSGRWPAVRARHLEKEPCCVACGRDKDLEVHHVLPLSMGGGELDPENLVTLCSSPCHLVFGHLLNFRKANPFVREDAARCRDRMRSFGVQAE